MKFNVQAFKRMGRSVEFKSIDIDAESSEEAAAKYHKKAPSWTIIGIYNAEAAPDLRQTVEEVMKK